MSLKRKAVILGLVTLLGGFVSMFLMLYVDDQFIFLFFALPLIAGIYSFIILRCPVCGEFMAKRRTRIFGSEVSYWGGIKIPENCSRCGASFASTEQAPYKNTKQMQKRMLVLAFLAVINLLGSVALAIYLDPRFFWAAVLLPLFFLILMVRSGLGSGKAY